MSIELQLREKVKQKIQAKIKKLESKVLEFARNRVPRDTEALKDDGLQVISYEQGNNFIIQLGVSNAPHPSGNTTYLELAEKLEIGINLLTGAPLLRTQTSAGGEDGARTPTSEWFSKAVEDIRKWIRSGEFLREIG